MDEFLEKVSMIDQLIINEKKSKRMTVTAVVIVCLLGVVVFVLSAWLNNSNKKYKDVNVQLNKKNEELLVTQKKLEASEEQLKYWVSSLKQDSQSFARINDSLMTVYDDNEAVKLLLNETLTTTWNNDTAFAKQQLMTAYQKYYPNKEKDAEKLINSILVSPDLIRAVVPDIGVSVLYMPDDRALCLQVEQQLKSIGRIKKRKVVVAEAESVPELNFNNSVRYFSKDDEAIADQLADNLNKNIANLKKPFVSRLIDFKAVPNQIEVWVGEYRPKEMIISLDKRLFDKKINK